MFLSSSCQTPQPGFWGVQLGCWGGLFITTTLSLVLILASARNWNVDRAWYESQLADVSSSCPVLLSSIRALEALLSLFNVTTSKRASVEFAIRLGAISLGFLHILTIAILVQHEVISDLLSGLSVVLCSPKDFIAEHGIQTRRRKDGLASRLLSWVVGFSCFGMLSAALWAGAMTPTASTMLLQQVVDIPSFDNMSFIKEYPVESPPGLSTTTREGFFSYSVGTKLLNALIASGSSASTPDSRGSFQGKPKIDNTCFFYQGRSYGVGSSVGIGDAAIRGRSSSARMYRFQEIGYMSTVECRYNKTMDFRIEREYSHRTYAVTGFLPDTVGSAQWSEYIGSSPNSIVAIGVAHSPQSPRRYLSIAAGENYRTLNATECTIDFSPTLFQVTAAVVKEEEEAQRCIIVSPLKSLGPDDFDPQRALARTAVRQFDLMSNSLTSFHDSVLGDAFLSSIAAWNISHTSGRESDATLAGLQNSLTAMMDSMLEAYGAAQLVVGNFSQAVVADVSIDVFTLGNTSFVAVVWVLNAVIAAAFFVQLGTKKTLKSL